MKLHMLGLTLLLVGCTVPDIHLEGKRCDDAQPCVAGQVCCEGRCQVPGRDASTLECFSGVSRSCGSSIGECKPGKQQCGADGRWATDCQGAVGPAAETCDGKDNDCDGVVDNVAEADRPLCAEQRGVCAGSRKSCAHGAWQECGASVYAGWASAHDSTYEALEKLCDGKDNDCDGRVDDIAESDRPLCAEQQGVCAGAHKECVNGRYQDCGADQYLANSSAYSATETCDGLDNDCDGNADESFACIQGAALGGSCKTSCGITGTRICSSSCTVACQPPAEVCNGRDDDCDGTVDNGLEAGPNQVSASGVSARSPAAIGLPAGGVLVSYPSSIAGYINLQAVSSRAVPSGTAVQVATQSQIFENVLSPRHVAWIEKDASEKYAIRAATWSMPLAVGSSFSLRPPATQQPSGLTAASDEAGTWTAWLEPSSAFHPNGAVATTSFAGTPGSAPVIHFGEAPAGTSYSRPALVVAGAQTVVAYASFNGTSSSLVVRPALGGDETRLSSSLAVVGVAGRPLAGAPSALAFVSLGPGTACGDSGSEAQATGIALGRLSSATTLGAVIPLSNPKTSCADSPAVAALGADQYLVAWLETDVSSNSFARAVRVRWNASSGAWDVPSPAYGLTPSKVGHSQFAAVAAAADGNDFAVLVQALDSSNHALFVSFTCP